MWYFGNYEEIFQCSKPRLEISMKISIRNDGMTISTKDNELTNLDTIISCPGRGFEINGNFRR